MKAWRESGRESGTRGAEDSIVAHGAEKLFVDPHEKPRQLSPAGATMGVERRLSKGLNGEGFNCLRRFRKHDFVDQKHFTLHGISEISVWHPC
jgi:hypothetical protein